MPEIQDQITIIEVAENPELMKCLEYLLQCDAGKTKIQIAEHFNVTRGTLYNWLITWERSGVMERASELYLIPKAEEIQRSIDRAITEFPKLVDNMVRIATNNHSDRNAIDATEWLYQRVILPALKKQDNPGSAEKSYIQARITAGNRVAPLELEES